MVAQFLQEQENKPYSDEEKAIIGWALKVLWGDLNFFQEFDTQNSISELMLPKARGGFASNMCTNFPIT